MNTFATLTEGQKQSVIEYAKTQGVDITTQPELMQNTFTTMWFSIQAENAINSDNVGTQTQKAPNNSGAIESKPPSNVIGIFTLDSFYKSALAGRTLQKDGTATRPFPNVKYFLKDTKKVVVPETRGEKGFEYMAGVCVSDTGDTIVIGLRKYGKILKSVNTINNETEKSFIISQEGIDEIWTN